MLTESRSVGSPLPIPSAATAQLTLRLRDALQDTAEAEATEAALDVDAAFVHVQARLRPLIEARRRSLGAAIEQARVEAAATVCAARVEAAAMLAPPEQIEHAQPGAEVDAPTQVGPSQINVVIDAEAFARVIATVLGEHLAAMNLGSRDHHAVQAQASPQHAR